jgi:hypothetical protein
MAAVNVLPPDTRIPFTDPKTGCLTDYGYRLLMGHFARMGAETDKVDLAHVLASNAVPQGTVVAASGGLKHGGALGGNIGLTLYVAVDGVDNLPTTGLSEGDFAYAANGRKTGEGAGAGTGVPCWWSNGAWYAADSGAVVSA